MQNPIPEFRQSSFIFEKQGILPEKWKLSRAPTSIEFNIFCWYFAHTSYLTMSTKGFRDFFILLRSWVINKNVKKRGFCECIETRSFLIFANNSRFNFQLKILNSAILGARQKFQFFKQKTCFLESNRNLSKFLYGIL